MCKQQAGQLPTTSNDDEMAACGQMLAPSCCGLCARPVPPTQHAGAVFPPPTHTHPFPVPHPVVGQALVGAAGPAETLGRQRARDVGRGAQLHLVAAGDRDLRVCVCASDVRVCRGQQRRAAWVDVVSAPPAGATRPPQVFGLAPAEAPASTSAQAAPCSRARALALCLCVSKRWCDSPPDKQLPLAGGVSQHRVRAAQHAAQLHELHAVVGVLEDALHQAQALALQRVVRAAAAHLLQRHDAARLNLPCGWVCFGYRPMHRGRW